MCGGVGYGTRCTGYRNEEQSPSSQASARSRASARIEEEGRLMAKTEEVWTQLATRIPKELHRRLKLHCVTRDIALMHFVVEAIEEELVHWQYRTVTIESARGRWTPR